MALADDHIDYDTDPEDLSHAELRELWSDICQIQVTSTPRDEIARRLWNRRREIWREMASRVDAQPPECPECGHRGWSQAMGEPKHCDGCDHAPTGEQMDLIEAIDDYWNAVKSGPKEVA